MGESAFRKPALRDISGASRDDLETLVKNLVKTGSVEAEVVNAELDAIRETTSMRAKAASGTEIQFSPEQAQERLASYSSQYEELDRESKARCSWEELKSRLLANNGRNLGLAEGLNQKGVLFGVDNNGNPLIADAGDEPLMTGMDYPDTRNRVMYEYEGNEMVKEKGKPVPTGYELFPYEGDYEKSVEIKMYEQNTGNPIVASSYRKEWRSIWLESGQNPSWPRNARFYPDRGNADVNLDYPRFNLPERGVRRLLRVKKS